jgi:hypothetical protein
MPTGITLTLYGNTGAALANLSDIQAVWYDE